MKHQLLTDPAGRVEMEVADMTETALVGRPVRGLAVQTLLVPLLLPLLLERKVKCRL